MELIRKSIGVTRPRTTSPVLWRVILTSPNVWVPWAIHFYYGYRISIHLDWFPRQMNDHRGFNVWQMGLCTR